MLGVLAKLARERRIAILVATQELDRVARHADRVLVLHEGRIGMDARPLRFLRRWPGCKNGASVCRKRWSWDIC